MFYTIQLDRSPNEYLHIRDPRTPEQLASAIAADGVLVVERGDTASAGISFEDGTGHYSYQFTYRNRVVLVAEHILRIDEVVLRPGTKVTEN